MKPFEMPEAIKKRLASPRHVLAREKLCERMEERKRRIREHRPHPHADRPSDT